MAARLLSRRAASLPENITRVALHRSPAIDPLPRAAAAAAAAAAAPAPSSGIRPFHFVASAGDRSAISADPCGSRTASLKIGRLVPAATTPDSFRSAKIWNCNSFSAHLSLALPRFYCAKASAGSMNHEAIDANVPTKQHSGESEVPDVAVTESVPTPVVSFSPLEGTLVPRKSTLWSDNAKVTRNEFSVRITYALIPTLLLVSKWPEATALAVFSVFWQVYWFFKEIFLDYVHHEITRKWVLIYFKLLLLVLAKDVLVLFNWGS